MPNATASQADNQELDGAPSALDKRHSPSGAMAAGSSPPRRMLILAPDPISIGPTKLQDERTTHNLQALPVCSTRSRGAGCESTRGKGRRHTLRCPGRHQAHQGEGSTASMYKPYPVIQAQVAQEFGISKSLNNGKTFPTCRKSRGRLVGRE